MALLKKVKAATLVETLVASVIILIVFSIGSLSLNNVFQSVIKGNDGPFRNRVKELHYKAVNNALELPYYEETINWDITIEKREGKLILDALYKPLNVTSTKKLSDYEQ